MMAQIKAVGVLQSRPVYGNLLFGHKKDQGKWERGEAKNNGWISGNWIAQAEDALHHQ